MNTYDLRSILRQELKNRSTDLVTRQSGQAVRSAIEQALEREHSGAVIALDFSGVGIVDYSCADEVVAKLISRLLGGEYGDTYLLITGLNENQRENIEVALERKDLAAIAFMNDGRGRLLGNLHNYLRETLDLIIQRGKMTAKDLARSINLEANTSGTRLLNLHRKRLVVRREERRPGGKVWVYEALQNEGGL